MKTCTLLLAAIAAGLLSAPARAETVVARARVGNNTEGMTFAPNGRWKDSAVAIDGNDVIAISLSGKNACGDDEDEDRDRDRKGGGLSGPGWQKIFDVLGQPAEAIAPRGIVYVPTSRQFLFSSVQVPGATRLFRADENGKPLAPLNITGLGDISTWSNWEGLAFLAPNTIAGSSYRSGESSSRVYFIDAASGAVQREIIPQAGTPIENYLCAIQYEAPKQRFLVSVCTDTIYAMGTDGSYQGIVQSKPGSGDIESIVFDRQGRMFVNGYGTGRLWAYDAKYRPLPRADREFTIGAGLSAGSLAWNPDTGEFLSVNLNPLTVNTLSADLSVSRTLWSLDLDRYPAAGGIGYLGAGQIAVGNFSFPRGAGLFDLASGFEQERLVLQGPGFPGGAAFRVAGVSAYAPGQLAVRSGNTVHIVTTDGAFDNNYVENGTIPSLVGDIALDAPAAGGGLQIYDDGGGRKILAGGSIYDGSGHLLHAIDQAALGLTDGIQGSTWISGKRFAAIDGQTSTVVIFTVP